MPSIEDSCTFRERNTLDPNIKTWAAQLQKAGYVTATMGKWHLSRDPIPYGFDVNIGGTHSGGPPRGYYPPHGNVPGLKDAPQGEYVTDRLSDEADQVYPPEPKQTLGALFNPFRRPHAAGCEEGTRSEI